jgi:hypothetical protein
MEGRREVRRLLDYYNLDMIISVGYRVRSRVVTRLLIWATQQLSEFINLNLEFVLKQYQL